MADPSSWEILDNGCSNSVGWDVTEVNAGSFSVIASPGVYILNSPGFGEVYASYTNLNMPIDMFTMEFRAGFKELNSRMYSVQGLVGAGYYSFGILFSEDGIAIQNSSGYTALANTTKYFDTDTFDTWRVINYPNAGKLSIYRNGYPVADKISCDFVSVNTGVSLGVGTEGYRQKADMYFSDVKIAQGEHIPVSIYDEKRSTVGQGTAMWDGMGFFHATDTPDRDLELYVKFLGGRFDTEKYLIETFIDNCVDVDTCATRFLPLLGSKVGYTYNGALDVKTNRNEIKKQIPKKRLDHSIAGIKRELHYYLSTNLIENGSFEKASELYTFDMWGEDLFNAEISSTTGAYKNSTALQCELTAGTGYGQYGRITSTYFPVDPASHLNLAFYSKVASTIGVGDIDATLHFYDDNYALLNFGSVTAIEVSDFDTEYVRYSANVGNYSIPDTAVYGNVEIKFLPGQNVSTYFLDSVRVNKRPDTSYKLYETEPIAARFHGTETERSLLTNYDGHSQLFASSDYALSNANFLQFHFKPGDGVTHDFDYVGWHMEDATSTYIPDSGPDAVDYDFAGAGIANTSIRGLNGHGSVIFDGATFGRIDPSSYLDPRTRSCVLQCNFASNTKGKRQQLWSHVNAYNRFEVQLTADGFLEALVSSGVGQSAIITGSTDLCDNNFHSVSVLIGRYINELRIYEDQSFVASTSLTGLADIYPNQYASVGVNYGGFTNTFLGHINEIQFKKAGASVALTYFETEIAPEYWTVDIDDPITSEQKTRYQYTTETIYNFDKSLQIISATSSSLLYQEDVDATRSCYYALNVNYLREGTFRCLLTNLTGGVTYFDSTDTTGTGWNNFYHEFQLVETGFVIDMYGEGTTYIDTAEVVKVDPKRRWGNCRFIGTKYSPCTVVIEGDELQDEVIDQLRLQKIGGSQMLVEVNNQDDISASMPSFIGYTNTSPYAFASINFVGTTAMYGN